MSLATDYNGWHQRVFDADPGHADEQSPWYKLVLEYLVPVESKRILEIACGRGGFARFLASKGAVMFAADFSATALQLTQAKMHRADNEKPIHVGFAQADAQQLPYTDESFDIVVSCETIEHLPDPYSALLEMARVCRSGGLLYLTTPNYLNAMGLYNVYARIRRKKASPGSDQPFDRIFLFPQVRRMLKRAGWKIVQSDGTVHQFPIWPGHNPWRAQSLEFNPTLRRLLSPLAFHYFVMARKADSR